MGGKIPEDKIQQIKQSTDIVDVVGQYVELERSGKTYKARCPFHDDSTPSFSVHPQGQFYNCFGCDAGGGVIRFLMEIDGMTFPEAVRDLAEQVGVEIERTSDASDEGPSRQDLYRVNEWALKQFRHCFWKSEKGERAKAYLKERNFDRESVNEWKIGFAPDEWDFLTKKGPEDGFSSDLLKEAGLIRESEKKPGHYDRFRGRIMFPIRNRRGRVVGFGGRVLPGEDEDRAKYLNSPETRIFQKRKLLYGLYHLDRSQVETDGIWIAEGYTDVIRCAQAGQENVVATLGTAIGEGHAKRLRGRAEQVYLLYDADEGGESATRRSLRVFLEKDMNVYVGVLPEGEDPCSLIDSEGIKSFRSRVKSAPGLVEYRVEQARENHDLSTMEGKRSALKEALEDVRGLKNNVQKELFVGRIAEEIGIRESTVRSRLRDMENNQTNRTENRTKKGNPTEEGGGRTAAERSAELIIGLMGLQPGEGEEIFAKLRPEQIPSGTARRVFEQIVSLLQSSDDPEEMTAGTFLDRLADDDLRQYFLEAVQEVRRMKSETRGRMKTENIRHLQLRHRKEKLRRLRKDMKRAYEEGDEETYQELLDRVSTLQDSMRNTESEPESIH